MIKYNIEEFSEGCYVQKTVITKINDENIRSTLDEHEANDDWQEEWELIGTDYNIDSFEIRDQS